MELKKIFNTGVLPHESNSQIAVNLPPDEVIFYNHSLQEIHKIDGYQLIGLSDKNALLRIDRDIIFYSITNQKVTCEFKNTRIFPFPIDENILFTYRKSPTIELRDFSTAETLWRTELTSVNRIVEGTCNSSYFIGNILDSLNKICIDMESGELKWQRNTSSFLDLDNKFAGRNYLLPNVLVSLGSSQDYFGVNIKNGEPLWHLDLEKQLKMSKVISDTNMFLFVREVNDVYLLKIDLSEGKILCKELLTEQIQRLQVYPQGNTGTFGQLSYYDNQLFFGANNQLVRLDLSSFKMEIIFEHTAEFYFSKVIGSKLFYSDNNFTTLVFELDSSNQET
ncbi:hypothetical protein [Portibacter lacus]|uniref:PQQ-like domain-containing protein n=1 Tax=Portibacter lacus TaxID=1099794 RepID=A0AA37WH70_9BACT|nr:hypothetical protein [Portibacter lacus]GLR19034.1 hypothetical protein GCM10007940_36500 [Portibacter lacus]